MVERLSEEVPARDSIFLSLCSLRPLWLRAELDVELLGMRSEIEF
jgi:hypothetical protein